MASDNKQTQFAYLVYDLPVDSVAMSDSLNQMGQDGWELILLSPHKDASTYRAWLRRTIPKQES